MMKQSRTSYLSALHYFMQLIFLLILLNMTVSADAAIYRYRDAKGNIFLTDTPDSDIRKKTGEYELLLPDIDSSRDAKKNGKDITSGLMFNSLVNIAQQKKLPSALLMALIKVESNFNPNAVSPKGAKGLMQLMPAVCNDYGVTDPFDITQNISAGAGYLREMIDRFNNLELALAAYNAGPEAVEKHKGVPPYDETKDYLKKVYIYLKQYYTSN